MMLKQTDALHVIAGQGNVDITAGVVIFVKVRKKNGKLRSQYALT